MTNPIFNSQSITNCTICNREEIFVGEQSHAHDGTLLLTWTALKYAWDIEADWLTTAQAATLRSSVIDQTAAKTFTDVDTSTYSCVIVRGSFREERFPDQDGAINRIHMSFRIEEAA
jgi:hypothetical protein